MVRFHGSGADVVPGALRVPLLVWHQGHQEQTGLGGARVSSASFTYASWLKSALGIKKKRKKEQEGLLL